MAEGLPLIVENASNLRQEAEEVSTLGHRRSVGILEGFADEEAAKAILLLDAVRCPEERVADFNRLIRQFDQHLAKCICAYYYNTRPQDLREVERIVKGERAEFYREGEYGEYILPNRLIYMRERRLYVDYFRSQDGSHDWHCPYPPDVIFGSLAPSGVVRVAQALRELNILTLRGLQVVHRFWSGMALQEQERLAYGGCNARLIEELIRNGFQFTDDDQPLSRTVVDGLLYPLYPFDLSPLDNFPDLPPPDEPDW